MAKRLEQGGFKWPSIQDGVMRLTAAQLCALLEDFELAPGAWPPKQPNERRMLTGKLDQEAGHRQ